MGIVLVCILIFLELLYLLPTVQIERDISYGLFLCHWIVLNLLLHFQLMNRLTGAVTLFLFIGITLFLFLDLNNPDKMSPTLYLSIEDIEYEGMTLLWVYVPPTSTVEKCANRIYDRKSNTYAEHKIFPYVTMDDLRMDLMDQVRNLAKSKNPDHLWLKMSDEEILKSAGLWEKDFSSGIQGYNLAGVLLFGKDEVIRSCCPGYITDAIYRVENLDRYDDRLQVTTNLIEAYELLMEFVVKHTSDKFCLIDNINTSIRGIISREVIANILVHRDYSSVFPAKVIIEKDWLKTENWCIPRRHGNIMSDEFTPYPKNPLIQQFFANIGRT